MFLPLRSLFRFCPANRILGSLAYAELYMTLGLLIRRMGSQFRLFETDKEDVEIHFDRFVPTPKQGTKGIRCLILPG